MLRKLGWFALMFGLVLPAWSAERPGTISGYVRDGAGTPQMGAVVEILGSQIATAFTDEHGFFSAGGLLPGVTPFVVRRSGSVRACGWGWIVAGCL